jgi:hypothetical protein
VLVPPPEFAGVLPPVFAAGLLGVLLVVSPPVLLGVLALGPVPPPEAVSPLVLSTTVLVPSAPVPPVPEVTVEVLSPTPVVTLFEVVVVGVVDDPPVPGVVVLLPVELPVPMGPKVLSAPM